MVDLTTEEKATMATENENLSNVPDSSSIVPAITQKENVEAINIKFWDESNNRIVNYETESKNLNGNYPDSPVIEDDIISCSNFQGRLYNIDDGDIFRHESFDGTPVLSTEVNELKYKNDIYTIFDELVSGFTAPASGLTVGSWSGGSGQSDTNLPNGRYLVGSAIVIVTNSVVNGSEFDITYTEVVSGTIGDGDSIGNFGGFSNTERQNKTATLQAVMDYYLTELGSGLTSTISVLDAMITAVTNNDDPNLPASVLTAHSDHRAFINIYNTTMGIDDTGISAFKLVEDVRVTNIPIRVGEIDTQLSSLRDTRYNWSSARANSSEGSLTMQKRLQNSKIAIDNKAQSMTEQKEFYENNMEL